MSDDVNAADEYGWTALMRASLRGHLEVVQLLIANGAWVHVKSNEGWTALMRASLAGHLEVVQTLLAQGVDVKARQDNGVTALRIAHYKSENEVVQLLKKAGANEYLPQAWQLLIVPSICFDELIS